MFKSCVCHLPHYFNKIISLGLLMTSLYVTSATWSEPTSYNHEGSVILGGMFPLHFNVQINDDYALLSRPTVPVCSTYNFRGFRWMQAMLFAIEEINNRTDFLKEVKLGWKIFDTCDTTSRAVTQAMTIVRERNSSNSDNVDVLIGPTSSDKSIGVANILGIYDIPQISYGSTSSTLSNKLKYNSFLRTIPNDDGQATAIADLLEYYNWTWVGAIGGDDEYGRPGIAKFKQEASNRSICVEFEEYVSRNANDQNLTALAERIQNYNATVFVIFMGGGHFSELSIKLKELGVYGKIWVASDAWATSRKILEDGGEAMYGTLGITARGGPMKGFREFLQSVSPSSQKSNPFLQEFWEETFNCTCMPDVCKTSDRRKSQIQEVTPRSGDEDLSSVTANPNLLRTDSELEKKEVTTPPQLCSGDEDFSTTDNAYLQWTDSELEKSYTAYLAVYAVAHALENITNCTAGAGLLEDGKCPDINNLEPWQLLAYLKKVKFQEPGLNEIFGFDSNGDPNATYKLVSWVPVLNGTLSDNIVFRHVGNYSKEKKNRWSLQTGAIYWKDKNGTQVFDTPISICSFACEPGFYQFQLASACCHKCVPCSPGEYSNATNAVECIGCGDGLMPSENRTYCISKPKHYIRWGDAYGITFTCLSLLGMLMTTFTAVVFFLHRTTPIVKATNVEISFLIILSLMCCFLTPLIYIAKPEDWSCRGRQISFILSFTLCVSAILVKTLRVLTAFQSTIPLRSRRRSRWLGEHLQILVVLLVSLVQVVLCVTWLVVAPPLAVEEKSSSKTLYSNERNIFEILVYCDPGSQVLLGCTAGYLAILALAAFVFAFRARKLPENFNEAKFITFSMLIFFIVWMSFIPAYVTTNGVTRTAVYCTGILASTYGILGCIFFQKLYIILVTPENNTSERVRMNNVTHTFRSASKSVVYQINTDKKQTSTSNTTSTTAESMLSAKKTENSSNHVSVSTVKHSYMESPCLARALKGNSNSPIRRRSIAVPTEGKSKGKKYSIEINGKMTSSVKSPIRATTRRESDVVESSFDVTLQVNITPPDLNSSREDIPESPRSVDEMLPDVDNESDITSNKRNDYKRVPMSENLSQTSQSTFKKSHSFIISSCSDNNNEQSHQLELDDDCHHSRSSSA